MLHVELPDVEATEALGAALAHEVQRGDVIFLRGELGSGKTSLARGFMRRFFGDRTLDVPSPSYLLHFVYSGSEEGKTTAATESEVPADKGQSRKPTAVPFRVGSKALVPGCPVHHVDPYRLPEGKIAALVDFEVVFAEIALVEWPERLGSQLTDAERPPRLEVVFEGYGPQAEGRKVSFSAVGKRWQDVVERWRSEGGPLRKAPSDPLPEPSTVPAAVVEAATEGSVKASPSKERRCQPLPPDPGAWRVLGVESSCDDTGAAVLNGRGEILGEALASQAHIHEQWGGVVPRLAQEGHRGAIDATVEEALRRAGVTPEQLTAVAVTVGPGLGLCLEVGVRKALQIAAKHRLPLVRVHHMEAHMLVTRLPKTGGAPAEGAKEVGSEGKPPPFFPAFPFLTLLVSGGHNMAVLSRGIGNHTILGSTTDDSIGEAFDKTARILGITQVPGGPHLERLAKEGDASAHKLPKPLSKTRDPGLQNGCDYSFSGLKTAVKTLLDKELPEVAGLPEEEARRKRADVAASFQSVAVEHLCERAARAAGWAAEMEPSTAALVVAGGVAANQQVRAGLRKVAEESSLEMHCPPPRLCVDNGVMVAWAGVERLFLGLYEEPPSEAGVDKAVEIRPRWPLGSRDPRSQLLKLSKAQKRKASTAEGAEAKRPALGQGAADTAAKGVAGGAADR